MPISIERQRSQTRVGHIRIGELVPNKSGDGTHPEGRSTYRFTCPDKAAMENLKAAYPGILRPWKDRPGEWDLSTEVNQISVIVDTRLSVDENFTQNDGKTRTHQCDGLLCKYVEIRRKAKKIIFCEDRGIVPCLCDPDGLGADLQDRQCDLSTTLRVILPATKDITLWQLTSKGVIFNKEVNGMVETLRSMGLKHAYCLLTIHKMSKTVGEEVTRWVTARLTLDANPPDFVKALMENTMEGQARRLALQLPQETQALTQGTANALPTAKRTDEVFVLATQAVKDAGWNFSDGAIRSDYEKFKAICKDRDLDWALVYLAGTDARCADLPAFQAFATSFDPDSPTGQKTEEPEPTENLETVEGELVEEKTDPFADGQPPLVME